MLRYESNRPIPLVTGSGATSAESAIDLDPFGSRAQLRAFVFPDCPPILSLGELAIDVDFDFAWKAKTLPVITTPEGVSHQLELEGRGPRRQRARPPETEGPGPTEKT